MLVQRYLELAHDQRLDDGGALVFDSPWLIEAVEILSAPSVELEPSADKPDAMVVVRPSDVAPDHDVTRVTSGFCRTFRTEMAMSAALAEPGARYQVLACMTHITHAREDVVCALRSPPCTGRPPGRHRSPCI